MKTHLVLAATALAATPAFASGGPPDYNAPYYDVANETGQPLDCRYWINGGFPRGWQEFRAPDARAGFTLRSRTPGETVTLDCNDPRGGKSYTVEPFTRYRVFRNDAGRVVVKPKF